MLNILLLMTVVGILSAQTFRINEGTLSHINTLEVIYINPGLSNDVLLNNYEHAVLLKMSTLLTEVKNGRHPQWRANNIVELADQYIDMNKERRTEMERLNSSMKSYLEQAR